MGEVNGVFNNPVKSGLNTNQKSSKDLRKIDMAFRDYLSNLETLKITSSLMVNAFSALKEDNPKEATRPQFKRKKYLT